MPIDKEMLRKLEVHVAVTWWGPEVNMVIVIHFKVKVSWVEGFSETQLQLLLMSVENDAGIKSLCKASVRWADQWFNTIYRSILN